MACREELVEERTGVTWFLGALEGTFSGTPFAARLRYTRTWIHDDDHGWRVVAAHAKPACHAAGTYAFNTNRPDTTIGRPASTGTARSVA